MLEIFTIIVGILSIIGSFVWGILSAIEGIIGSIITIFYGSYDNFKKRIKNISPQKNL